MLSFELFILFKHTGLTPPPPTPPHVDKDVQDEQLHHLEHFKLKVNCLQDDGAPQGKILTLSMTL